MLVLVLVLLSTLTISSWLTLNEEKQRLMTELNTRGSDISRFVSKSLTYSVVGYDYHTIDLLLKEITLSKEVGFAKVTDIKGNVLSLSGTLIDDHDFMQLFIENIQLENDKLGELTIGINTSQAHQHIRNQQFRFFKRELLITIIIVLGEFFALSYLIIRPVTTISQSLITNKKNNTAIAIPLDANDEFGHLAEQFNDLNTQLGKANFELQNRVDFADKQLRRNIHELLTQKAELTKINEQFLKLSITDSLTNLFNRRYFEEQLENEINLSQRHGDTVSLILIDIDHFKNINDTYGHVHGDEVLVKVANLIMSRTRKTDIACRIGGEEFIIICKRVDKKMAIAIAEDLRKSLQELVIPIDTYSVHISISAGVVTLNQDNFSTYAEHLYRYVDNALYFSKENGRNAVTHYDDII